MTIQFRRKHQFMHDINVLEDDLQFIEEKLEEMQVDDGARGQRRPASRPSVNHNSEAASTSTRSSTRLGAGQNRKNHKNHN